MTKKRVKPKGKAKKVSSDSGMVRILAVKRPPTGVDIAEERLPESPYIIQDQLADFLGVESGDLDGQEDLTPEQYAVLCQSILNRFETRMSESPSLAEGQFLVVMLSEFQSGLYDGVYEPLKGNPFFAMDAFLHFHRFGLYPPTWVLSWLATAFGEYMKSKGEKDLSQLLGVKPGTGQMPAFKKADSVLTESQHMQEMGRLTVLDATIEQAAEMVFARQEKLGVKCSAADTLVKRYGKRGWSMLYQLIKSMSPSISLDDKKQVFAMYPSLTIPPEFR